MWAGDGAVRQHAARAAGQQHERLIEKLHWVVFALPRFSGSRARALGDVPGSAAASSATWWPCKQVTSKSYRSLSTQVSRGKAVESSSLCIQFNTLHPPPGSLAYFPRSYLIGGSWFGQMVFAGFTFCLLRSLNYVCVGESRNVLQRRGAKALSWQLSFPAWLFVYWAG